MKNKISIEKKQIMKRCGCTHQLPNKTIAANPNCKSCNGTGELEDSIYYFIDEKNKIAIDSDTLA
jgi:DnaJ-class molecular chaperone